MARELYVRRRCCSRDFFVLAVVNAALVTVAALMLYFRQQLSSAKWLDVARGAFNRYADTFATGMLVLGAVLLGLVLFGSIVTLLRVKKLLVVYGMALTLTLIAMTFLAVSAFQVSNEAAAWKRRPFSATSEHDTSKEALVAAHFDAIYCDAQKAYFCDHATLNELLAFGLAHLDLGANASAATMNSLSNGASSMCQQTQSSNASSSTMSAEWSQLCAYCARSKAYDDYESVASWTQDNCAFSASTTAWCSSGANITSDSTNSTTPAASPYSSCRTTLLQQTSKWSRGFGIAWSATCFLLFLLLICVALLLRTHEHAEALDLDDVESHTESAVYEKA